jgi:hypothetical protein
VKQGGSFVADFYYYRLDTQNFPKFGCANIVALKNYYNALAIFNGMTLVDEDPNNLGDTTNAYVASPRLYGVSYHCRPYLETLIGHSPTYNDANDNAGGKRAKTIAGGVSAQLNDTIHIYNLSHLSNDPEVIGDLVDAFIKSKVHLHVVSVDMSTVNIANPREKAFFHGIVAWKTGHPKAHLLRGGGGGVSRPFFGDGGGDGGGNGGC